MEYFLLQADKSYCDAPNILNWYSHINKKDIHPTRAQLLPKRTLLFLENNPHTVFTDMLLHPIILVSDAFGELLKIYEPAIEYKDVVLLDRQNARSSLYYLPILAEIDCLTQGSEFNLDHSVIKKAVLAEEKIEHYSIFRLGGLKSTYIAARLDLIESALRRGMRGLALTPVEIARTEDC